MLAGSSEVVADGLIDELRCDGVSLRGERRPESVPPPCSRRLGGGRGGAGSSVLTARSQSFEQVVSVLRDHTDGDAKVAETPATAATNTERRSDQDMTKPPLDARSFGSLASQLQASGAFAQRRAAAGSIAVFE